MAMSQDVNDETRVGLRNELSHLVRKTRERRAFLLPESIEYALKDWRFWDVPKRLQEKCNELTRVLYDELQLVPIDQQNFDDARIKEYILFQGLLLEWRSLETRFVRAGIEFAVPR
jgi:hypothetical protein